MTKSVIAPSSQLFKSISDFFFSGCFRFLLLICFSPPYIYIIPPKNAQNAQVYYPAKTTVTVEKDKDSKDYGKICAVSVVLSEKKEQQISVEQIVIGESTEEKKQEISQDYSTLRNELAQLLHITISCVEVKQKSL